MSLGAGALVGLLVEAVKGGFGYVKQKGAQSAELTKSVAQSLGERAGWVVGLVFVVWAMPFVYLIVAPEAGSVVVMSLERMPEWYRAAFTELSYGAAGAAALFKLVKR